MEKQFFWIDAFTGTDQLGNPAAVVTVPASHWPRKSWMQHVAFEMGILETAFVLTQPDAQGRLPLRWFTPTLEDEMCGHATMAAARAVVELTGSFAPSPSLRGRARSS